MKDYGCFQKDGMHDGCSMFTVHESKFWLGVDCVEALQVENRSVSWKCPIKRFDPNQSLSPCLS